MAEEDEEESVVQNHKPSASNLLNNDRSSTYCINASDDPGAVIVSKILVGEENYYTWNREMRVALIARRKLSYILGTVDVPAEDNHEEYDAWQTCNGLVLSWIYNAVDPGIAATLMYTELAAVAWEELEDRYVQANAPRLYQLFQLQDEISTLTQEQSTISVYFNKLKALWDQLDAYSTKPTCTCGASKIFMEKEQEDRVIQFLLGLNANFVNIRGQILSSSVLPNLSKALALVLQEEKQKNNVRGKSVDVSAFYTSNSKESFNPAASQQSTVKKNTSRPCKEGKTTNQNLYCDHWIHGFLVNRKLHKVFPWPAKGSIKPDVGNNGKHQVAIQISISKDPTSQVTAPTGTSGFTPDQYMILKELMDNLWMFVLC